MSEKKDPFKILCLTQAMRLESLGTSPSQDAAIVEIRNFLMEKSAGNESKVRAVIDECMELDSRPALPGIRAIWARLFPPVNSAGCDRCRNHVGYIVVERNGVSGSMRCPCGATAPREYAAPADEKASAESMRSAAEVGVRG